MTTKSDIKEHFSETAKVWKNGIYKSIDQQRIWEYFDKQYRFNFVADMIPPARGIGAKAMDMGCGSGQMIPVLAAKGYNPYGIDVSEEMTKNAKDLCEAMQVRAEIKIGDCEKLEIPDHCLELYVAMGVIEYMTDDSPMLAEIARTLTKSGYAIITFRNKDCLAVRWREFFQAKFENKILDLFRIALGKAPKPFRRISKEHTEAGVLSFMRSVGFEPEQCKYCHYHVLPYPLDRFLKPLENVFGKALEWIYDGKKGNTALASTLIVKFRLKDV